MNVCIDKRNQITLDRDFVCHVSKKMGLNEKLVELLSLRGIDDEQAIRKFLYPDISDFYDPFLMKGMRETVDRLSEAIENNETVVVYGDYDADGVCAAAILSLYLSSRGLDVRVHIPNRVGEGYGLNIDSLGKIIEDGEGDVSLIITCDCGISGYNEVEFVQDLGVDIIVTDHHEISGKIPDCVVVNPKQEDCAYPYNMLCGAGVALKVVEAMAGRQAMLEYVDLACVATIADLVPLVDENRIIVQLGLKRLNERKNLGLAVLFKSLDLSEITSGDVAFKVAPRINAAGRMGDAFRAFEILTSTDSSLVKRFVAEIEEDNIRRKQICDEMFEEAVGDLAFENLIDNRAIVLSHPEWEKGITGIVAARLAGDYNRPAFILVRSGDTYKGTCRSVDGVNIHDLLTSCGDLLVEFGGHSQAAGFSILPENIDTFKTRVNDYLKRYDDSLFLPRATYDMEITEEEVSYEFVQSLALLEPTGNGNPKPLFKIDVDNVKVSPCKSNPTHINFVLKGGLQIFAFSYSKQAYQLLGDASKCIVTELQTNNYGGKSIKGIMKCCLPQELYVNESVAEVYYYSLLKYLPKANPVYKMYSDDELDDLTADFYGTLIISPNKSVFEEYSIRHNPPFFREYMYTTAKSNFTRIVVAPSFDDDNLMLSAYKRIVFLSSPLNTGIISFLNKKTKAEIYLPTDCTEKYEVSCEREIFGKYFEIFKEAQNIHASSVNSLFRILVKKYESISLMQFLFCLQVFEELGFVTVTAAPFALTINRGVRADLGSSKLYSHVKERI